jgi:hypothetical protein
MCMNPSNADDSNHEAEGLRRELLQGEEEVVSDRQRIRNTHRMLRNLSGCLRGFYTLNAFRRGVHHKFLHLLRIDIVDEELGLLRLLGCDVHGHSVAHISDPYPPICD